MPSERPRDPDPPVCGGNGEVAVSRPNARKEGSTGEEAAAISARPGEKEPKSETADQRPGSLSPFRPAV